MYTFSSESAQKVPGIAARRFTGGGYAVDRISADSEGELLDNQQITMSRSPQDAPHTGAVGGKTDTLDLFVILKSTGKRLRS